MLVLANAGQVKVTGPDGKPAVAAELNATELRNCIFAPENRVVSASERIAVRSLGQALGLSIPSGQENDHLLTIVDRCEQAAEGRAATAPAPPVPEVPGIDAFRATTGNDLLAELAARAEELKPLIAEWQAAQGGEGKPAARLGLGDPPGVTRRRRHKRSARRDPQSTQPARRAEPAACR